MSAGRSWHWDLLQTLPHQLEQNLQEKKETAQKEMNRLKDAMAVVEAELVKAREESKAAVQAKATQLAATFSCALTMM